MDETTRARLDDLRSEEAARENAAFEYFMEATNQPVGWAYEVWDEVVQRLADRSNRQRAIAAQLLCGLAKSDPEERILGDLDALLAVTRDERFVTARHCMQSLWRVGAAGERQRRKLVEGLVGRFAECAAEKNCTLIRYDIIESLRKTFDASGDESLRQTALGLIATEEDPKYRKKYATLWKTA